MDPQVKKLRDQLYMPVNAAQVHCDGSAIKSFVTHIKSRLFASDAKRETLQKLVICCNLFGVHF